MGFDLGEPRGVVQASVYDRAGVITSALSIPNSSWPGYWSNGASSCRISGYVERFDWTEGRSPAYIVQTVDGGWHYEFRPSDLLPLLPHAKIIAALRECLERIDQGAFGEPLPRLPRPKLTRFKNASCGDPAAMEARLDLRAAGRAVRERRRRRRSRVGRLGLGAPLA